MMSLETNWIRKKLDKTLPSPNVMYFPLSTAGGRYYYPKKHAAAYDLDGKSHSMKNGLIIVDSKLDIHSIVGVIIHEFRHHWQHFNGVKYDKPTCSSYDKNIKNYEKNTLQYFSSSIAELDAIRYEYSHTKFRGQYEPWEKLLYPFIKDLRIKSIITYGNTNFTI